MLVLVILTSYEGIVLFFVFKQKTAYDVRISDWGSDVCSSDLDDQGKEALNCNITVGIAFFVLFLLAVLTLGIRLVIAIPLWIIIGIAWLVFTIIAAIKANEGVAYRYPFTLRLVK